MSSTVADYAMFREEQRMQQGSVAAQDKLNGMTFEEAKEMVDSGAIRQEENPYFVAAFQKQFGLAYAARRKRQLLGEYLTSFDKERGDLEGWLTQAVQDDQEAYAGNKFVYDGVREGMGGFLDTLRNRHAEYKAGRTHEDVASQFYTVARDTALKAVSSGKNPLEAVRSLYGPHRSMLGMTYAEMDDAVMEMAQEFALAGDYPTVKELLQTDVTGEDGTNVGSFITKKSTAVNAQRILAMAEGKHIEMRRRSAFSAINDLEIGAGDGDLTTAQHEYIVREATTPEGLFSDRPDAARNLIQRDLAAKKEKARLANIEAIKQAYQESVTQAMQMGMGWTVEDKEFPDGRGGNFKLKADAARQIVVDEAMADMEGAGKSVTEQARTLVEMGSGTNYGKWEAVLNQGYAAVHPMLQQINEKGEVEMPPALAAGYETFKSLAEFPQLRNRHIKEDDAATLYETAEVLERVGGMPTEQALITAAKDQAPGGLRGMNRQVDRAALEKEAAQIFDDGFIWDTVPINQDQIRRDIEGLAEIYMRAGGINADAAVAAALENVKASYTPVLGYAVNTRDFAIPPEFETMAETVVNQYAEKHGLDPSTLALNTVNNRGRVWTVIDKATGLSNVFALTGGGVMPLSEIVTTGRKAVIDQGVRNVHVNAVRRGEELLEGVPEKFKKYFFQYDPDSDEYRELQKLHGKKMFPDGGRIPSGLRESYWLLREDNQRRPEDR
jgi:hypothetical protein